MHENDGRMVSKFIVPAVKRALITLYGGGGRTPSLCDVDNIVRGPRSLTNAADEFAGPVKALATTIAYFDEVPWRHCRHDTAA